MSEFKGTPAPWTGNISGDNASIDIILPNNTVISVDRQDRYSGVYVIERTEMEANAKLISKAPEMLEMLKRCEVRIEPKDIHISLLNDLRQLIKEATE
ncbi:hypothetical protein [Elizabethkingia meningoseptica]|uniref:hypothetical protein n=1 Tax=Elizabethkingia meningoseptica TaxID=238 RepID=UPI001623F502|nr:hypothetical protein [Elizabethkingia meningoseptica]MBG0512935.1 hypothetical protein [Elizabethkingia meningoseptica]MBG0515202.1 hypothetical protein [Elizabethkingia meningoseptica]